MRSFKGIPIDKIYGVLETVAELTTNIWLDRRWNKLMDLYGDDMGGSTGVDEMLIEGALALERKVSRLDPEDFDFLTSTRLMGEAMVDFVESNHYRPAQNELNKIAEASVYLYKDHPL